MIYFSIYNVNGRHLTMLTFIIVAASVPFIWYFRVQMGQTMTNGIFYYCCVPGLIFGILALGYYHKQYITKDNELIEEIGYFSFGKIYKINIMDITKIIYSQSIHRGADNQNRYGQEQVSFYLINGMEVNDFTLVNKRLMSLKIKEINYKVIEEEMKV